ncbi:hypothetical protein AB4Y63_15635 [Leifsonia sp. YAF41]|uniref:hypothetical protein n=1 Tax=Leifsonia sp. YAF41 TaxID=3233086 RepID=UPI003F9C09E4
MSQSAEGSTLGLEYYVRVLRRQWLVIVASVLLGGLIAGFFLLLTPTRATATADVNINIISTDPFNASKQASSLLDGTTETQIATSYSVAKDAANEMGTGASAAEVRRNVSVDAVTGASVVHIAFTAPTAAEAQAGADAVAGAYLAYRTAQAQTKLDALLKGVETRRTQLGEELANANSRISSSKSGTTEANQAASDRDLITMELNTLLTQKSVLAQIDTAGGSVLTTASQNDVVVKPSKTQTLGAGLLVGGVLGLIAAFIVNPFDRRLRNAQEVRRITGAPILADISSLNASIPASDDTLELLRVARERILTDLPVDAHVITIFDDTPGEVLSDIPVNLAVVMAEQDLTTHLILPGPPAFSAEIRVGLDLISQSADESGNLYRSGLSQHLDVFIPAEADPAGNSSPDMSKDVRDRVSQHRQGELHFVVLDHASPRSSQLAALRHSDAVVIVAALRASRSDRIADVVTESARLGIAVLGTIAVPRERSLPSPQTLVPTPAPPGERVVAGEEPDADSYALSSSAPK